MVATPANLRGSERPRRGGYEEYHPYGSTAWWSGDGDVEVSRKRYRYTGMERDEETGLQCHGVRYYAPWLGRWMSADPIGLGDGVNRFGYVQGGPIGGRDESGMAAMPLLTLLGCVYDPHPELIGYPPEPRTETQGDATNGTVSYGPYSATMTLLDPKTPNTKVFSINYLLADGKKAVAEVKVTAPNAFWEAAAARSWNPELLEGTTNSFKFKAGPLQISLGVGSLGELGDGNLNPNLEIEFSDAALKVAHDGSVTLPTKISAPLPLGLKATAKDDGTIQVGAEVVFSFGSDENTAKARAGGYSVKGRVYLDTQVTLPELPPPPDGLPYDIPILGPVNREINDVVDRLSK